MVDWVNDWPVFSKIQSPVEFVLCSGCLWNTLTELETDYPVPHDWGSVRPSFMEMQLWKFLRPFLRVSEVEEEMEKILEVASVNPNKEVNWGKLELPKIEFTQE